MANRLEEFVHLTIEKEENSDVKSDLYNNWRIVNGESRSIHSHLFAISTIHMGDVSSDWDLLQYSIFRVDEFISGMTNKFLENHSYAISSEEKDNELVDIEGILQSIKEPMLIIDGNYSDTLERIGR